MNEACIGRKEEGKKERNWGLSFFTLKKCERRSFEL
jgi:hypothetical protein